jgi:hypothetical protein
MLWPLDLSRGRWRNKHGSAAVPRNLWLRGHCRASIRRRYHPWTWTHVCYSRSRLNFYTSSPNDPTDQIFVYFSEERSVGVKTMRKCVSLISSGFMRSYICHRMLGILEQRNIQRGIIVFPGNMTPSARKVRWRWNHSVYNLICNRLLWPWPTSIA